MTIEENIVRGTTDPEIDSVTKFRDHMAAFTLVSNLDIRWHHLHSLKIWPQDCVKLSFTNITHNT